MVMVGAVVDAAIGWLVQSILDNLFSEKLMAWTRGVGLADDVEKLMLDMRYVRMVVAAAKGRKIENKPLAQSLEDLKQLLYDAEDVIDELDFYRLQEQVTNGNDTNGAVVHSTGTPSTWSFPQIGSTLMGNVGSLIPGFSLEKRKREDGHSVGTSRLKRKIEKGRINIASDTDLDKMSLRITDIAGKLRHLGTDVAGILQIPVSDLSQSTPSDERETMSHLSESKVYGRDTELEFILKQIPSPQEKRKDLMVENKCSGIIVVPIVGVGGVGKTTLARLVYNDPIVGSRFDIKMWLYVSDKVSLLRLTREMLGYLDVQRQAQICNLDKLQKDLLEQMKSKRFLIVLDDVWNSMTKPLWDKLLAPLKQSKDSMILVTTRESSVAEMAQTVEPVMLGALEENDIWLLLKSCVFGDEESEEHPNLHVIGKQIALKLRGNPMAAKTVGAPMRSNISMASWTNIRDNEEWKSLQYSNGIMPALKLSYDYLPDHLQQCFRYCCLFPKGYRFDGAELVRIWISQGFVHHSDTGKVYLANLVKSGFFQQAERDWSSMDFMQGGDTEGLFVMHDLMHDLAWEVSRPDFATINGSGCVDIRTTTRHLSIIIDSAYNGNDPRGNTFSQESFDEKLNRVTLAVKKLRSLVLIGHYEPPFFKDFCEKFKEAENLRLLQISASYTDFVSFLQHLEHHAHLRYLKLENKGSVEDLPIPIGKFYHLQVLDVGCPIIPSTMNGLVNMQYLGIKRATLVTDPYYNGIEMLQSMNDLVHLGVYQLKNVSRAEADRAKLRDKQHLEKLHLSWKDPRDEYASDTWSESEDPLDDTDPGSESGSTHMEPEEESASDTCSESEDPVDATDPGSESTSSEMEPEEESSPVNGSYSSPVTENIADSESRDGRPQVTDTDPDLEQPSSVHMETVEAGSSMHNSKNNPNYEHFTGTAIDVLDGLKPHHKLKHLRVSGYSGAAFPDWLSSSEVSVTCLQTLHLDDCGECQILPSLESLRFLTKLKLRNMRKITEVSIPPLEELVLIKMPKLERCFCNSTRDLNSSLRVLLIERCGVLEAFPLFESCDKLGIEHKSWLSGLSELTIHDCPLLIVSNPLPPSSSTCKLSISRVSTLAPMKGSSNGRLIIGAVADNEDSNKLRKLDDKILAFHNLRVLTHLTILRCENLSYVSLKCFRQLISLKRLTIQECDELFSSDVLEHAHEDMETANFSAFPTLKHLSIHSYFSNKIMGKWVSVMLRHAPVLEELCLHHCKKITGLLLEGKESCLSNHNSSPRASSPGNPDDASTSTTRGGLVHIPSNLVSSLKILSIEGCSALTFLEKEASFSAFTSLEELQIRACPKLISYFEPKVENSDYANGGYLQLKRLLIDDCSILTTSFCKHLTSLQCLEFVMWPREVTRLTNEQDGALQMITSLQVLQFFHCSELVDLPVGLHSLSSLKILQVISCPHILSLPEKGLPPSLEELEIVRCNQKLASECRLLATSMLKVRISNY